MSIATTSEFHAFIAPAADTAATPKGRGLLARLSAAYQAARIRRIDAEIARLIEMNGGRMTDEVERRICRDIL